MSYPIRIGAVALILAGLLVGLAARETLARAEGTELILPMRAMDPRDLLTGHYAALDLGQALPAGQACPPGLPRETGKGWIAFAPAATGAHVVGFAQTRAASARFGPVTAKGRAGCWRPDPGLPIDGRIDLDLGVRRFHADQKRAEAVEAALRGRDAGQALAIVSVGKDGKARLKGVIVGGQRLELDWK